MSPLVADRGTQPLPVERVDLSQLTDEVLLDRFLRAHEDAAFTALVTRHGPLVLNVCRRVLGNSSDAEDAFQATFLILVKKGATLQQPDRLGNWLYGVADRTARKFKAKAALRSKREARACTMAATCDPNEMSFKELRSILDEEIGRLPEKYAQPLVLCYLEGKTNAEAAELLGWPAGSMSRRLSRARELLRWRLTKRGLPFSILLLAGAGSTAAEEVPAGLIATTVDAAGKVARGTTVEKAAPAAIAVIVREVLATVSATRKLTVVGALATAIALLVALLLGLMAGPDESSAEQRPLRRGGGHVRATSGRISVGGSDQCAARAVLVTVPTVEAQIEQPPPASEAPE
jgi:RNA polymerase sigma-70 factor (ECF subfamily)